MTFHRFVLITLVFFFLSQTCSNQNNNGDEKEIKVNLKAGKISERTTCRSNPDFTYHFYLPVSFNATQKYPLIIIFDAHARSIMALSRFIEASNKYGYIIVASDQARNGIQDVNPIINAIWDDVVNKLPIDISRIYTAGFSGGARIAASIAIYKGGIKGVIGCGGGMPLPGQELKNKFDFISVVGTDDLNYQELKTLDKALFDNGFNSQMLTFDGGHEWPDSLIIADAVEWLEIMAMKQKRIPINDMLVRNYTTKYADLINKRIMFDKSYEAFLFYNIILRDLDGLYDIKGYISSYNELLKDPRIEKGRILEEKIKKEEIDTQEKLLNFFKGGSFGLIKNEAIKLQKLVKDEKNEQFHKSKRLLGFLGMLSFLYTESSLNSQNKEKYLGFMEIYELLEPKNPDILFFKACQSVMDKSSDKAMENLQKAINLGFYDFYRLQTVGYFEELRMKPEFDILLALTKENFEKLK